MVFILSNGGKIFYHTKRVPSVDQDDADVQFRVLLRALTMQHSLKNESLRGMESHAIITRVMFFRNLKILCQFD